MSAKSATSVVPRKTNSAPATPHARSNAWGKKCCQRARMSSPEQCTDSAMHNFLYRKCCAKNAVREIMYRECCTEKAPQESSAANTVQQMLGRRKLCRKCCAGNDVQEIPLQEQSCGNTVQETLYKESCSEEALYRKRCA